MFAVLLLTVPAFYLQLDAVEPAWRHTGAALYAFVAAAFLVDLAYRRRVRRDHDRLWNIWLDAALIVGAAASALSWGVWSHAEWALRSILLVVISLRLLVFLRRLFSPHDIVYLLGLGAGMLALAGAGFYWLEPSVHSYADGLWLAFESGATVGYGDLVPTHAVVSAVRGFHGPAGLCADVARHWSDRRRIRRRRREAAAPRAA